MKAIEEEYIEMNSSEVIQKAEEIVKVLDRGLLSEYENRCCSMGRGIKTMIEDVRSIEKELGSKRWGLLTVMVVYVLLVGLLPFQHPDIVLFVGMWFVGAFLLVFLLQVILGKMMIRARREVADLVSVLGEFVDRAEGLKGPYWHAGHNLNVATTQALFDSYARNILDAEVKFDRLCPLGHSVFREILQEANYLDKCHMTLDMAIKKAESFGLMFDVRELYAAARKPLVGEP